MCWSVKRNVQGTVLHQKPPVFKYWLAVGSNEDISRFSEMPSLLTLLWVFLHILSMMVLCSKWMDRHVSQDLHHFSNVLRLFWHLLLSFVEFTRKSKYQIIFRIPCALQVMCDFWVSDCREVLARTKVYHNKC